MDRCDVCRYVPDSESVMVLSLVLSPAFSSRAELSIRAADIRAHRKWAPSPDVLARATAAYQQLQNQSQATSSAQPLTAAKPSATKAPAPDHKAPQFFATNSFVVVGASPRDSRRQILALVEDRSLTGDADMLSKARAELTHPRARLSAELSYLPGLSPKRAAECLAMIRANPAQIFELEAIPALAQANLLAAVFDSDGIASSIEKQCYCVRKFCDVVERVDTESVRKLVNEDRGAAGFSEITAPEWIEAELS